MIAVELSYDCNMAPSVCDEQEKKDPFIAEKYELCILNAEFGKTLSEQDTVTDFMKMEDPKVAQTALPPPSDVTLRNFVKEILSLLVLKPMQPPEPYECMSLKLVPSMLIIELLSADMIVPSRKDEHPEKAELETARLDPCTANAGLDAMLLQLSCTKSSITDDARDANRAYPPLPEEQLVNSDSRRSNELCSMPKAPPNPVDCTFVNFVDYISIFE